MKILYFFSIVFILLGCKDNSKKGLNQSTEEISEISIQKKDSASSADKDINSYKSEPIPELLSFVSEIEQIDWVPDTLRLKKTGLYKFLGEKVNYRNYPFYKIDFENSPVNLANEYLFDLYESQSTEIDLELFKNAKSIWGYFYRDKFVKDNFISDGVIEQWEFENDEIAERALEQISTNGSDVYFNTMPFFCRIRNYLIIFSTRAMGFSYDQKKLFLEFKKKNCVQQGV